MSVLKKRFRTALPKLPVPPVIRRVLSLNKLIFVVLIILSFRLSVARGEIYYFSKDNHSLA